MKAVPYHLLSHATYIGKNSKLKNEGALVQHVAGAKMLTAQFDSFALTIDGKQLFLGWHRFPRKSFRIRRDSKI